MSPTERRPSGPIASAGRVIAGTARGTLLAGVGSDTRPLGDRVKQALFAILEPAIRDRWFLDLFAGTGAGGIEALSRGAAGVVFVERDRRAVGVVESNVRAIHASGSRAIVVRAEALAWLRSEEGSQHGPFGAVLVDPPYDRPDLLIGTLAALADQAPLIVGPGSIVVAKHFWRTALPAAVGLLASVRERRFGETTLTFYRLEEDG